MRSAIQPVAADEHIIWQAALARRWSLDRITIYRMDREGKLPPPDVVIGRRRGRYLSTIVRFERESAGAA
jgi:hypothetical protein